MSNDNDKAAACVKAFEPMADAARKNFGRKRTILEAKVVKTGEERYSRTATLGMSSATAADAESAAAYFMRAANAQLDYSGSQYRLGVFDKTTGERMNVVESAPAGDREGGRE